MFLRKLVLVLPVLALLFVAGCKHSRSNYCTAPVVAATPCPPPCPAPCPTPGCPPPPPPPPGFAR